MTQDRDPLVESLLTALDRTPDDTVLRLHLAQLLFEQGRLTDALAHCSQVLLSAPSDPTVRQLLSSITCSLGDTPPAEPELWTRAATEFDWERAEHQMVRRDEPTRAQSPSASINDRPGVGLDDVGGMEDVKREIVESLLIPMANPELRAAYGSTLRNGLLLYGPPGCGKTFLARALAGEMGANFYIVSLADVLDSFLGQSERNIRLLFDTARANPPSVIFFDELDAIGQKRTNLRASPLLRGTVNQLLAEMDGAKDLNDGLFILGASNQPWDIDPALKRPGRFSRTLFVPPPDREARMAILRLHLAGRPVDVVDFNAVVERTTGYSGADLAQVCEIATRRALVESARTGIVHPVKMEDLLASLTEVRSTVNEWFTSAENVVKFANQDGTYDGLAQFMRSRAGRRR